MTATIYTTSTGSKALRFNGETEEQANARYAAIDAKNESMEIEMATEMEKVASTWKRVDALRTLDVATRTDIRDEVYATFRSHKSECTTCTGHIDKGCECWALWIDYAVASAALQNPIFDIR